MMLFGLMISCLDEDKYVMTSITIEEISKDIFVGDEYQLEVSHNPSRLPAPDYTWKSSDTNVASVSNNGKLKALKEGTTKITVAAERLELSSELTIKVLPVEAKAIKLNLNTHTINSGESFTLIATVEPNNTTNKTITWASSDVNIATVDDKGVVTTLSDGKVTITASIGSIKDECVVTVIATNVSGIELDIDTKILERLETFKLSATVKPESAKDKTVIWSTSDKDIATVDDEGTVTATGLGNAVITATTRDGNFKATCSVTVNPISVKGINVKVENIRVLINEEIDLSEFYTITPENAENTEVIISNSDSSIATLSNGKIKANKIGNTTVTFKTVDGGHEVNIIVNVVDITGFIDINFYSAEISSINGWMTGNVELKIVNNNTYAISEAQVGVRSFNDLSPSTYKSLGDIKSKESKDSKVEFRLVYRPFIVCKFKYEGLEYLVEKEYTMNWYLD